MRHSDAFKATFNLRLFVLTLALIACAAPVKGQASSSAVYVVTVYSENGKFYLKTVPFDDEFPTTRGKTLVYETGNPTPLYFFERGFDSVARDGNNLILGDDGETIFYAIPWDASEEKEGLKSITIYRRGKILKSYTETEVNGCDEKRERCTLLYSNYETVVDKAKSNWGTSSYKKAFKDGVDEKEKFLSDFPIFSSGDEVYLTDSKRRVHVFDLKEGSLSSSDSFDDIYEQLKGKGRFTRTEMQQFNSSTFLNFPKMRDGRMADEVLAEYIGMKAVDIGSERDEQLKWYSIKFSASVLRDGSAEVEMIEADPELPKEKILEFFRAGRFDTDAVPLVFEKWNTGDEYFYFRKSDARLARRERAEEKLRQAREHERRLAAESIEGAYIPKDLGECFAELDKLLSEVDKSEMRALPSRDDMIQYHFGFGMWLRNRWGLWGGSRLQKYFMDRGVQHPDNMSGVVLLYYHDWLNGRRDTWKAWEKDRSTNKVLPDARHARYKFRRKLIDIR
jgi:hypothetical protein